MYDYGINYLKNNYRSNHSEVINAINKNTKYVPP